MNDTTRRFLASVLERVGEGRLVELRLFPALRQGGIESAVAVIAVEPLREAEATAGDGESAVSSGGGSDELQTGSPVEAEVEIGARLEDRLADLRGSATAGAATPDAFGDREVELPQSGAIADASEPANDRESILLGDLVALPDPGNAKPAQTGTVESAGLVPAAHRDRANPPVNTRERLQILSATYRLVFKGPERGQWQMEIIHEADAPLETLERVVHGVARRAGDTSEAEMFTADSLRTALAQPVWV
ncbi:MAG: hypothetical protein ACT4OZ_11815 [Gemmatimonadota bacterium]